MSFENPDYIDQWQRVLRWYNRLNDVYSGIPHGRDSHNYEDDIHAFFENCFHLKDWLINSNKPYPIFSGKNISVSESMKICQAICIGNKHLKIDDPTVDKDKRISRKDVILSIGSPHIIKVKYYVNVQGKDIDVKDTADNCIKEWKTFLIKNKLLN